MKEFMRKLLIGILIIAIVVGSAASLWVYYYYQQKSPDNLPNLQSMKAFLTEKGEVYASEKIAGYDKDTLKMVWGESAGELFGMDGRVWKVEDTCSVTIYFDGETATNAKLVLHNEEETKLTFEALDAIVPALQVDGELYYLAGESWFSLEECGMMDGEITSTVERWEMPTEDNQSNFGEYSYQFGNEGFIKVLQDGTWYYYGTRSEKGRVLFKDWWFDLAYISEETLEWLEWYLEQPEEIQEQAYVPAELRDPFHLDGNLQRKLEQRKLAVLDALNSLEYQDGNYDILPEYEITFDENNIFAINETEMLVWKDFKIAELPEELYAEMYDIGLLEYYQMEDGKWKYRGYIYDQMIEMIGRTPNAVKDSRYVVLTNNPDVTFEQVYKHLLSSSMSEGLDVEETVVVEIGVE